MHTSLAEKNIVLNPIIQMAKVKIKFQEWEYMHRFRNSKRQGRHEPNGKSHVVNRPHLTVNYS